MFILKKLGLMFLNTIRFLMTMILPGIIVFSITDKMLKQPVTSEDIPKNFPVFVVTSDNTGELSQVHIVEHSELEEFIENHTDYSFLVPKDKLSRDMKVFFDDYGYWIKVEQSMLNKQSLVVSGATYASDSKNIAWYDATEKEIFPKYHLSYFEPAVFVVGPGGVVYLILVFMLWEISGVYLKKLGV